MYMYIYISERVACCMSLPDIIRIRNIYIPRTYTHTLFHGTYIPRTYTHTLFHLLPTCTRAHQIHTYINTCMHLFQDMYTLTSTNTCIQLSQHINYTHVSIHACTYFRTCTRLHQQIHAYNFHSTYTTHMYQCMHALISGHVHAYINKYMHTPFHSTYTIPHVSIHACTYFRTCTRVHPTNKSMQYSRAHTLTHTPKHGCTAMLCCIKKHAFTHTHTHTRLPWAWVGDPPLQQPATTCAPRPNLARMYQYC
jgi:hypothetical protein